MLYVFTGNGKGKTTASLGMGLRASGAGLKVVMIQFLKPGDSSEIKSIKKLSNFRVFSFGRKAFILPKKDIDKNPALKKYGFQAISQKDIDLANQAWRKAREIINSKKADLVILDEIFLALKYKLLNRQEVFDFLKQTKNGHDIVLTGRYAPREFIKLADLATLCQEKHHYFNEKFQARKGFEF